METKIEYKVFEGLLDESLADNLLLENITQEARELAHEMMVTGHFISGGIFLPKFLRDDLTINLEKLELAVTLAVVCMESNSEEDITLLLRGLEQYYIIRGIDGNENKEREERTFLLTFISSIAAEASNRDTLEIKYGRE